MLSTSQPARKALIPETGTRRTMDLQTRPRRVRPPAAGLPCWIVLAAVVTSAAAHSMAAVTGPAGAMRWLMGAMALACLACVAPLIASRRSGAPWLVGRRCVGRSAGHLLATSTVMILIHLALIAAPANGTHHSATTPAGAAARSHDTAMLALIGVELLCLIAASAALRLSGRNISENQAPQALGPQPARSTS